MTRIHVEESALNELRNSLATAGEEYKSELARLTSLIKEITNGDIQGDPATDLLNKYMAKEDAFNALARAIEEAQEYAGAKGKDFTNMITDLKDLAK
jgi:uncharacterized protein YukE